MLSTNTFSHLPNIHPCLCLQNVSCHMPSSLPLQKDLNVVVLFNIIGFEKQLLGQI
jgi:hypothetical protein